MGKRSRRAHALLVRFLLFAAGSVALALLLAGLTDQVAWAAPAAAHHPSGRTATAITGVVVNGTHDSTAVPGLAVTLQATSGDGTHDIATATTDAQGRFTFTNLANADMSVFAVYTRFQQGFYSTGAITVDNGTQDVRLTVYDATNDPGMVRITNATVLLRDPRPKNGLIGIGEYYTFHNSGRAAFVGTITAGGSQPMGLLRFALPSGATNLTLGAGFAGAQTAQVPTGFGATATVPPGDSQFAFAFDLPYAGTTCAISLKAEYPTDHLLLLAPPPFRLDATRLQSRGPLSASGESYNAYTSDALSLGTTLDAEVRGLPPAGEAPTFDFGHLVALAVALGLALMVLVGLYLRRGDLASALRLVPATGTGNDTPVVPLNDVEREAERERLLRKLLALERTTATGRAARSRARQQAQRVRAELRALLATLPPNALERLAGEPAPAAAAPAEPQPSDAQPSRVLSGGGR